jgi:hypothetical protein
VVSSPAIVNGVLYVGSYDHMVYAIGTWQNSEEPTSLFLANLPLIFAVAAVVIIVGLSVALLYRRKHRL